MIDLFNYRRRAASEVNVGATPMGGGNPIRIQSMTTTPTTDTEASVAQAERIIEAGGEYVRLTTQGVREAENLKDINARLRADGYTTPLVADVHFNPHVAEVAALYAEKVRINPGNYVDPARTFKHLEYTDEEYADELKKIEERFVPLLDICKEHHTALRIGVNHGSLSDRIMSRYGDTPEGIVESCMEFLRICRRERFDDVVISIKASNTVVMVRSVRLLVSEMDKEGMRYPLHLGVTEAGEGEDGRIKSAVGIGALLADGIGDTVRVSLSEEPEAEIPVARHLVDYVTARAGHTPIPGTEAPGFDWLRPERRKTAAVAGIGGAILLGEDWRVLDPLAAVVVSFFIARVAVRLTASCIGELTEQSLPEEVEREITAAVLSTEGVSQPHHLRTRRIGNRYAIEMHVRMNGDMTLREAHDKATQIENRLKEMYGAGTYIGIHVEPEK